LMQRGKASYDGYSDTSSGGSYLDETDREVSNLTDRAFRSLCIGDEAVYNDSDLCSSSPCSQRDRQLAFSQSGQDRDGEDKEREELKTTAHGRFDLRMQQYGQDWIHGRMCEAEIQRDPQWEVYGERTQGRVSATFQHSFVETSQQEESMEEEQSSFFSNGTTELSTQQRRSRSRVSSLIRAFNSEGHWDGAGMDGKLREWNDETSWDKSALMSIQRELSEFSTPYQQNFNSGHFPSVGSFSSPNTNFYSSDIAGVAQMNSASSFMRSSHSKHSMSEQFNCNSNFFIHSEFSPFKAWRDHTRFPFQQAEVSGFMHCSEFPKWYETPMYRELSLDAQPQGPYRFDERGVKHPRNTLAPVVPPTLPHATSTSTILQKASAVEKRCESELTGHYPHRTRMQSLGTKGFPLQRPSTASPTSEMSRRVQETISSVKALQQKIKMMTEHNNATGITANQQGVLCSNTHLNPLCNNAKIVASNAVSSTTSMTPFNISQLLTPLVHAQQEDETPEVRQSAISPQPMEHPPVQAESRGATPDVRMSSYKSRATNLLFNLKDNRKRVKSTYSPTKFKGLETLEKNKRYSTQEPRDTVIDIPDFPDSLLLRVEESIRTNAASHQYVNLYNSPGLFTTPNSQPTHTGLYSEYTPTDQEEQQRKADQEEQQRRADQEEQQRRVDQEEQQRKAAQEEQQRRADQKEQKRRADQEEQKRRADQKEQKRRADQEEQKRIADQEEQKRRADQQEQKRRADQMEQQRKADQEEQKRRADQMEQKRKADQEEQKRRAAQEEKQVRAAKEEQQRRDDQEEQQRKAAKEERQRRAALIEEQRQAKQIEEKILPDIEEEKKRKQREEGKEEKAAYISEKERIKQEQKIEEQRVERHKKEKGMRTQREKDEGTAVEQEKTIMKQREEIQTREERNRRLEESQLALKEEEKRVTQELMLTQREDEFRLSNHIEKERDTRVGEQKKAAQRMDALQYYAITSTNTQRKPRERHNPSGLGSSEDPGSHTRPYRTHAPASPAPSLPRSNTSSPALGGKPSMFRVKDNTIRGSSFKSVKPRFHKNFGEDFRVGSPMERGSEREEDEQEIMRRSAGTPAYPDTGLNRLAAIKESSTFQPAYLSQDYSALLSQYKPYTRRSIALEEDDSRSVFSNMSEGGESFATSAADLADLRGLYDNERPESACSFSSDVSRSFGKPPTVPPKSEKALRRAQRLTTRRIKKELSKIGTDSHAGVEKSLLDTSSIPSSSSIEIRSSSRQTVACPHFSSPVSLHQSSHSAFYASPHATGPISLPSSYPHSYPLTQRKVLQDLGSGQYFVVDVPVQVKTKTFFDPETGKYVQLNVSQSGQSTALPQPQQTYSQPQLQPQMQIKLQQQPQASPAGKPFVLYQGNHSYPQDYQPQTFTSVPCHRSSAPLTLHQEQLPVGENYGYPAHEMEQKSEGHRYSPEKTPYMDTVNDKDKTYSTVYNTHGPNERFPESDTNSQLAGSSVCENDNSALSQCQSRDIITMSELDDFMEMSDW
uniref:DUF4585 domain-containing protein n=1 Tax=Cyclopterus lumpus TaxID=8103 RepID=A0A8C2WHA0_CYCLU